MEIKKINITSTDIVKNMNDYQKNRLAKECIVNGIAPEPFLDNIAQVTTNAINLCIEIANNFFESPAGREYLEMRKRIENIGQK